MDRDELVSKARVGGMAVVDAYWCRIVEIDPDDRLVVCVEMPNGICNWKTADSVSRVSEEAADSPEVDNLWEYVNTNTNRLRVPGGWLYCVTFRRAESKYERTNWEDDSHSITFVPDPDGGAR